MKYSILLDILQNPPKTCLSCYFCKQINTGAWTSRTKCKLLNKELHNDDFQNKPIECPLPRK